MDVQAILEAMDGVTILIDRDLQVERIGRNNWNQFRLDNGGARLDPAKVIGEDISKYFSRGIVRDTYRKLFLDILKHERQSISVDYRCDSPDTRRLMHLSVTPVFTNDEITNLLYQSILLSAEIRPAMPIFDAPTATDDFENALTLCSICAKVKWMSEEQDDKGEWIRARDYYQRGGAEVRLISHGFCPPCYDRLISEIPA